MSVPEGAPFCIREVWNFNLFEEIQNIRSILPDHPYVSIDTEFPGVVLRPAGGSYQEYTYQTLKANVDRMKLIQLGLTFTDEHGCLPMLSDGVFCAWQFNFREFDVREDLHHPSSIALLQRCGIDFQKNQLFGIDSALFGELLLSSGLIFNSNVHYICFHGAYDFAFLLKLLIRQTLPETEADFLKLLRFYFGTFYDLKYMQISLNLHGGLEKLAKALGIKRIGPSHQAGSDSLLTSSSFQRMKEMFFTNRCIDYSGVLYGLALPKAKAIY